MRTNHTKRILLFALILIAALAVIQAVIDYGVRNSPYSYYAKVNMIANHKVDPKIAFFGSSVGEVAFDAPLIEQKTNLPSYNFCIDGTRFIQYNGLVREFNTYSKNCELVVFAETFFSLSKVDQLTEVDRFLAHLDNPSIYASLHSVQPDLMWKLKYVPFYKFVVINHGYYKAAALGLANSFSSADAADPLKGYTPKDRSWERGLDDLNKRSASIDITIDSVTILQYKTTLKELRKSGKKVLIVIPPIHDDGLKLLPNLDLLRKTLLSLEGDGIYFRDYSRTGLSGSKEYFYNNSHVNARGGQAFSEQLVSCIDSIMTAPHISRTHSY